jgi:phosphatidylethanolamine/phosphatidyl-N-methylethanolamine N-methyltransferase
MPTEQPDGTSLFLKRWLRKPLAVGAVVPSGRLLAREMARATLAALGGHPGSVIELGAGTGEVSRGLLASGLAADRLVLVERDPELAAFLRRHLRGPRIVEGDAANLGELLASHGIESVGAVASGLPLLSLPTAVVERIVRGAFEALPADGGLVQFTYGPASPMPRLVSDRLQLTGDRGRRIWRNVPPAVVWTYKRRPHS